MPNGGERVVRLAGSDLRTVKRVADRVVAGVGVKLLFQFLEIDLPAALRGRVGGGA